MMLCHFVATEYRSKDGRPVSRCDRPGCEAVLFNVPERCVQKCVTPQFAPGDAVANVLSKVGVTEKSWPKMKRWFLLMPELVDDIDKPGYSSCGCKARKQDWNRWSFPLGRWIYRFLVWRGYLTKPEVSRLELLLAQGRIVGPTLKV